MTKGRGLSGLSKGCWQDTLPGAGGPNHARVAPWGVYPARGMGAKPPWASGGRRLEKRRGDSSTRGNRAWWDRTRGVDDS